MPIKAGEQHVLVVSGEADLHTASQLRSDITSMLPAEPCSLIVELGALEFCDLTGLDALHDAADAAALAGVELVFRGVSPRLSWLHRSFPPRVPVSSPVAAAAPSAHSTTPMRHRPGTRAASNRRTPFLPGPAEPPVALAARPAVRRPDPAGGHAGAHARGRIQGRQTERPAAQGPTTDLRSDPSLDRRASVAVGGSQQLVAHNRRAIAGFRQPVTASRARLTQPSSGRPQPRPTCHDATASLDPWRELETVVEQLARLVLGAAALAERSTAPSGGQTGSHPGRAQGLQRLHVAVELGQRALAAAVALT